jgi:hypothetical protein
VSCLRTILSPLSTRSWKLKWKATLNNDGEGLPTILRRNIHDPFDSILSADSTSDTILSSIFLVCIDSLLTNRPSCPLASWQYQFKRPGYVGRHRRPAACYGVYKPYQPGPGEFKIGSKEYMEILARFMLLENQPGRCANIRDAHPLRAPALLLFRFNLPDSSFQVYTCMWYEAYVSI